MNKQKINNNNHNDNDKIVWTLFLKSIWLKIYIFNLIILKTKKFN